MITATDFVFPVFAGRWTARDTNTMDVTEVCGTAFLVAPGLFLTAAHVLHAASNHEAIGLGRLTAQRTWRTWPVLDHEVHDAVDVALLQVSSLTLVAPFAWRFDELPMLEPVRAIGFPHGLDVPEARVNTRAFAGHVSTSAIWHGLPAKPRVYELTFTAHRGLSGAPLWTADSTPRVAGMVFGNRESSTIVEEQSVFDGTGELKTLHRSTEMFRIGLALQAATIRDLRFSLLNAALGDFLESHNLVARDRLSTRAG